MTPQKSSTAGYVLDTWPVMAYFGDEPSAQAIGDLLTRAAADDIPVLMTVVNVCEVWYTIARQLSSRAANQGLDDLRNLGVQFVPVELGLALQAASLKSKYKMSLADCLAAALAQKTGAELITGDPEFKQAAAELRIVWL
jgi:predicted nucleic acid-binding protein